MWALRVRMLQGPLGSVYPIAWRIMLWTQESNLGCIYASQRPMLSSAACCACQVPQLELRSAQFRWRVHRCLGGRWR